MSEDNLLTVKELPVEDGSCCSDTSCCPPQAPVTVKESRVEDDSCCSDTSCCPPQAPVVRSSPKIGRNDPCACGSGRKYKKCCG